MFIWSAVGKIMFLSNLAGLIFFHSFIKRLKMFYYLKFPTRMHKNLLHLLKLGIWKQWCSNPKYFQHLGLLSMLEFITDFISPYMKSHHSFDNKHLKVNHQHGNKYLTLNRLLILPTFQDLIDFSSCQQILITGSWEKK